MAASSGCSGNDWPGVEVSGGIAVGSTPIPLGSISFLPAPGHKGPSVTALIENGRFHVPAADGPLPGPHQVLVYLEVDHKRAAMGPRGLDPKQVPSTKTRWESSVEIPAGGAFTYDLKLD